MPTDPKDFFTLDLSKRLESIDLKLNNHMEHMAYDLSAMKTDIAWMKDIFQRHFSSDKKEEMSDVKTQTDVAWMKKFFWIVAGTTISSFLVSVFELIFKR